MEMSAPKPWCQTQVWSLFAQLRVGFLFWAWEVCAAQACPGLSCLAPMSALHPETGQLRAKSCRAGVAGGLLCGHLKHRASLSLKGKRQWHGKGLRSWAELKAELCNSGRRQESPQGEGGISSRFLHLGFSVRHAPVWVFWRALTHPLKASSPAHTIFRSLPHAGFWVLFYQHRLEFMPLHYQTWGISNTQC